MTRTAALALPLLLAACSVENDPANDQVTLTYNEDQARDTAQQVGNTAEDVAQTVGNAAQDAAQEVDNRVDIDINTDAGNATPPAVNQTNAN